MGVQLPQPVQTSVIRRLDEEHGNRHGRGQRSADCNHLGEPAKKPIHLNGLGNANHEGEH